MFQRLKVPLGFARTLMGPYGVNRDVHSLEFTDCENGLGIKVIGGVKELTGEEFGVFVKRVLPGGLASTDGNLMPGDQILEVNGSSLAGVTSERAVEILRAASASNQMCLLVARDEEAKRDFADLLQKHVPHSSSGSTHTSPVQHGGRCLESTSSGSSSPNQSPLLLSPAADHNMDRGTGGCSLSRPGDMLIQLIAVAQTCSLGISIGGGSNRPEGPAVFIHEVLPGGDLHRDGRLRPGDQLIAVNKESLIGVTLEEANGILNNTKSSPDNMVEIAYIPGKGLLPTCANGVQRGSSRLEVHINSPEIFTDDPASVSSPSDVCSPDGHSPDSAGLTLSKPKISLDPDIRLQSDKVDLALSFLGLDVMEEKKNKLKHSLTTDSQGTVAYGEFVEATRNVLQEDLEVLGVGSGPFMFSYLQAASLMDTSAFHSPTYDSECSEGTEQFHTEMKQLQSQMKQLQMMLKEMELSNKSLEEELHNTSEKACLTVEENSRLRSRLDTAKAEVVQRSAGGAEHDYEEVVQLLEAEIRDLKRQLRAGPGAGPSQVELQLKRKLTFNDCQLRRSEFNRKQLELSNRRLLDFVQDSSSSAAEPGSQHEGPYGPQWPIRWLPIGKVPLLLHMNRDRKSSSPKRTAQKTSSQVRWSIPSFHSPPSPKDCTSTPSFILAMSNIGLNVRH